MIFKISKSIRTLSRYVEYVEKHCVGEHFLFRGQPVDRPLLPKVARLVTSAPIADSERAMLRDFKLQSLPFLESHPADDWDWLALAQHHGMATRLLDWSLNPLAALFFAVERPPEPTAQGVVWMFEVAATDYLNEDSQDRRMNPFDVDRTRVFRPRHISRRIVAQAGWFTAHKFTEKQESQYIPLERNTRYKNRLVKLAVPANAFADLRRDLDRFGVNAASIYGGIDGLCRTIEWRHSFLTDELQPEIDIIAP